MSPSDTTEKAVEDSIESFLPGGVVATTGQGGDTKEVGVFSTRGKAGMREDKTGIGGVLWSVIFSNSHVEYENIP